MFYKTICCDNCSEDKLRRVPDILHLTFLLVNILRLTMIVIFGGVLGAVTECLFY